MIRELTHHGRCAFFYGGNCDCGAGARFKREVAESKARETAETRLIDRIADLEKRLAEAERDRDEAKAQYAWCRCQDGKCGGCYECQRNAAQRKLRESEAGAAALLAEVKAKTIGSCCQCLCDACLSLERVVLSSSAGADFLKRMERLEEALREISATRPELNDTTALGRCQGIALAALEKKP